MIDEFLEKGFFFFFPPMDSWNFPGKFFVDSNVIFLTNVFCSFGFCMHHQHTHDKKKFLARQLVLEIKNEKNKTKLIALNMKIKESLTKTLLQAMKPKVVSDLYEEC